MREITTVTEAKKLADELRVSWPDKAAAIDRVIAEAESGQRDGVSIKVGIHFKLEKFEGEITPGKRPVEVIEGEG